MRKTDAFRRAAALLAALSITVSLAAPAFAGTYYIDGGDITITKMDDGRQKIEQNGTQVGMDAAGEETIITTHKKAITTLESDLEGPAAEDTGFGPVVEDNYQPAPPAQPEDAEQPEGADQPESADQPENTDRSEDADRQENAEEPKDADQPENTDRSEDADQPEGADQPESTDQPKDADQPAQPLQAAPAPAPTASTPKNDKGNGFWGNTITLINNFADTVLNLTLKDVKIDVSDTGSYWVEGKAALSVQGKGNVEIELDGNNELKSGVQRAGLEKNTSTSTGTLTLKDDKEAGSGSLKATGGKYGAGIGGGNYGSGENITITGGTVNADGGDNGAGIGGGATGSGSNVTVSGAAQVTATTGKSDGYYGAGATIGNGGNMTDDGQPVDGEEIQADIRGVTTGYIHHIIYEQDGTTIKREWWEPERPQPNPESPQPNPEDPNAPAGESNEVSLGTPGLHVETLEGDLLPFDAQQQGSTLRVTSNTLAARLHGTRQALEALQEQGVEQIQFVTSFKTTTLPVADLLAEGGSWFALEHNGLVSRRLSAAQAESLKCQMR